MTRRRKTPKTNSIQTNLKILKEFALFLQGAPRRLRSGSVPFGLGHSPSSSPQEEGWIALRGNPPGTWRGWTKRKVNFFLYPGLAVLLLLISCQPSKSEDDVTEEFLQAHLLLSAMNTDANQSGEKTSDEDTFECDTSASPLPFCTLEAAGTGKRCGLCHTSGGVAPYDISNYDEVIEIVTPYEPENSLLYQEITTGGTMVPYTTPAVTEAIRLWILDGANP